ncbi:MAG: hypothetical protein HY593_03150 [Candidatus Omnitrophica bacterium]|nr:hypothetical protein [Candidatus Omnitrophota bacterium]
MNTKLTLKLENSVIQQAKSYARAHHISLSKMIEIYFREVAQERKSRFSPPISPLVRELSGVLEEKAAIDWKKEYAEHLTRKHSP